MSGASIPSYLNFPDHADDQARTDYAPQLANALNIAYMQLHHIHFDHLTAHLLPWLARRKTPMQQMRIMFLFSLQSMNSEEYTFTLQYINEALGLAKYIEDPGSIAILAKQAASACYDLQQFDRANGYSLQAMNALGAIRHFTMEDRLQYEVYERLARETFLLARYDQSHAFLDLARKALQEHEWAYEQARLHWLDAHVYRWSSQFMAALETIARAQPYYRTSTDSLERGRYHSVHADIALDCVEQHWEKSGRSLFLEQAEEHVKAALADARVSHDLAGEGLALLAHARLVRLARWNVDEHVSIDRAAHIARVLQDKPLFAQVWIARGDAMAWRRFSAPAFHCYQEAIDMLEQSDAKAYRQRPERILKQGMNTQ